MVDNSFFINSLLESSGTTTSLVYNWDGKLRKATVDLATVELKYDPAGNRAYTDSSVNGYARPKCMLKDIIRGIIIIVHSVYLDSCVSKKLFRGFRYEKFSSKNNSRHLFGGFRPSGCQGYRF